ncbi:MAG: sugar lactone lactonase YvrE [Candidatus Paceibacteria bacterium]|jgi:sugar lactone lactonase YvrE
MTPIELIPLLLIVAGAQDPVPSPAALLQEVRSHLVADEFESALTTLTRVAEMGLVFDFQELPNAEHLSELEAYEGLLLRLRQNAQPIVRSEVAFRLQRNDLLIEGIAFQPTTGAFLLSSVHQGLIIRRAADGSLSDIVSPPQDPEERAIEGPWGFQGLLVVPGTNELLAATSALEQVAGLTPAEHGASALMLYDLDGGEIINQFLVTDPGAGRSLALGDVACHPAKRIFYASCSDGRVVEIDDSAGGGVLRPLVAGYRFRSPQGLAPTPSGKYLYIADWSRGLFRVDLSLESAQRRVEAVRSASTDSLFGIDGLVADGNTLIAIQNAYRPHRIVRLHLDSTGLEVERVEVLEANHPEHAEPTLGTIVGRNFYYVANSQWESFGADASPEIQREVPVILRLPLGDLPAPR